jgi:hypothetical protein
MKKQDLAAANVQSAKVDFNVKNVDNVCLAIDKEGQSFGSLIRNFVAVCSVNDYARYMLDTITGKPQSFVSLTVNDIRKAVILKYPYRHGDTMLYKDGEIFRPLESYTSDIIRKAFSVACGRKKVQAVTPATAAQIEAADKKKADKKEAAKKEAATKKEAADIYAAFYNEIMKAEESDILSIVARYKAEKAAAEKAAILG